MHDLTYERLTVTMKLCSNYLHYTLDPKRFRSFRLHLGEEEIIDKNGNVHCFDVIWFKSTEELIAVEVEESLGVVLPLNFKLKKSTDRYIFLGNFTEEGIDDLLIHQGGVIEYLWRLHTQ